MSTTVWGVRVIYLVATVFAFVFSWVLWQNRDRKGAIPLCIGNLAGALWSLGLLLSTAPVDTVAIAAIKLLYLPVGIAIVGMFVFALEYTGQERYVTKTTLGLLAIHPAILTTVAIANPGNLFFTELNPHGATGVEQHWGVAFDIHLLYSYGLVLVYALLLLGFVYRTRQTLYRAQAAALVAGVLAPVPFNLIFIAELVTFDTTPIGFIAAAAFYTAAIVRYQYTNITPIAREKLLANVRDGMLVVDTDRRIVDSNPAAREMLGVSDSAVGSTLETVFNLPEVISVYGELTETAESSERTVSYGGLYIHIEATPIFDDRDRHVGWLFLLEDVTEQKRRERDLEQQIEKLDQFASLVSHDLRNPINVVSGYIQQTKATGDLSHLDRAEDATERMQEIIDDVLALAREGQDVTDPSAVSLEAIARDAWETVETGDATLVVERDVSIVADVDRLKRLFENLYRNSLEHGTGDSGSEAPDDSDLTVTVGIADEQATSLDLFVADDGIGIPVEDVDRVFEDGFTTDSDGTGLGLAIVEQIARAHGWTVSAVRTEPTDSGGEQTEPIDSGAERTDGARFEIRDVQKPVVDD